MQRLLTLALLLSLCACAARLSPPTADDAKRGSSRWAGYGVKEISSGHRLYILKCSSCHSLYRPEAYSEKAWNDLFPEMAEEARLENDEGDLILKYLLVMSGRTASI